MESENWLSCHARDMLCMFEMICKKAYGGKKIGLTKIVISLCCVIPGSHCSKLRRHIALLHVAYMKYSYNMCPQFVDSPKNISKEFRLA